MNAIILKASASILTAALGIVCAASSATGEERQTTDPIKVNMLALEHAKKLIETGHAVIDSHGDWAQHQPSAEDKNEFIRRHGFGEYAEWHLGIDERRAENTKARYKFPYGDFENVHRSALLAVKSRAHQYGYANIESAAVQLLEMIHLEKKQATSAPVCDRCFRKL
jgi:hypothetical protein